MEFYLSKIMFRKFLSNFIEFFVCFVLLLFIFVLLIPFNQEALGSLNEKIESSNISYLSALCIFVTFLFKIGLSFSREYIIKREIWNTLKSLYFSVFLFILVISLITPFILIEEGDMQGLGMAFAWGFFWSSYLIFLIYSTFYVLFLYFLDKYRIKTLLFFYLFLFVLFVNFVFSNFPI